MKFVKTIILTIAAALLFVSCEKSGPEGVLGTYGAACDKTVSQSTGSGIILKEMQDAIAALKFDFRTKENDKAVLAATDKIASERKDYASETIKISVYFKEANAMGEAEKKPVYLKEYTFTPVE